MELAGEGIDAEVIDVRTLRPLDEQTIIESVRKTRRLLAVDELVEMTAVDDAQAKALIMKAREHWFTA